MDGPVILAAKAALQHNDLTPVLKWVKPDGEAEVKAAFATTLAVRAKGAEARELADALFFETVVRIHRAGEGAPYTGLKPAGSELEPAIEEADEALESGSVEKVVERLTEEAVAGVRQRFAKALESKAHAEHDVEAGRQFVAAYVAYIHYVERLHQAAQGADAHDHDDGKAAAAEAAHKAPAPPHKH